MIESNPQSMISNLLNIYNFIYSLGSKESHESVTTSNSGEPLPANKKGKIA